MKKLHILASGMILAAAPLFSIEFGGIFENTSNVKINRDDTANPVIKQQDSVTLYTKIPLKNDGSVYFSAEGLIDYSYNTVLPDADYSTNEIITDLTLCKLSSVCSLGSGRLFFNAGRFAYSDYTALVISQTADLVNIKYTNPYVELSAFGGYTGLLNAKNVSIINADYTVFSGDTSKQFYDLAAPFIIGGASFSLPYVLANQTITLEGLAAVASSGPSDYESDGNRFYGTFGLTGPLGASVFYNLSSTVGYNDDSDLSNLSKLSISFYPNFKSSSFTLSGVYASGENGSFKPFVPFTKKAAVLSYTEPFYSCLLKAGAAYSIIPAQSLFASIAADAVFSYMESSPEYEGVQAALTITFQPFSDVRFNLMADAYVSDDSENNRKSITFNAVISF